MVCAICGRESVEAFKFCPECGAAAGAATPARESRRVVTIIFCDLTGSTALGDRTDPEALRATMRGYYDEMRTILERHGGTVEKFVGDAVMAVFGVPVAREDDALRAVRAAWEMRSAVARLGLQARIGVNTGEVVAGEGDTLVTGDAVNVAARLEQAAEPGEVLIAAATRSLVRDAVTTRPREVTAKGKPQPIAAFELVDLDPTASGVARRLDTPLVGRARELAQLRQAYQSSAREQSCHLFTLLGTAGVGKSRLVAELLEDLDATIARGRCLDYGEGITFWPVIEALKQLGAHEAVDAIASGSARSNELFLTIRNAFEDAARQRPLVVVFDDIHWGEPTFLDLLDHITDLSRGAPILLLCIARPELLDDRPGWGGGKLNATTTLLQPLSADESSALLDALDDADVSDELRARILKSAEGNPLFVEEMLALARDGGDIHAPSTIHALLQARLDRLGAAERGVIERGSVEGQIFHRGAVQELGNGAAPNLDSDLVGLVRKELIRPERGMLPGDDAYRFRHLLIRDVAYDGLPKEVRADLHVRFAEWLEGHADLVEIDEIVGYHLEQAGRYRRELGRPDPALELRCASLLATAGNKAAGRGDLPAADNLLARALALMPPDDPGRRRVLLERIAALETTGDAEEIFVMAAELEASGSADTRMHGKVTRLQLGVRLDPASVFDEVESAANEALEVFSALSDHHGVARAWYLLFWFNWLQSRSRPALDALEHAIKHAERAGSHALAASASTYLIGPLVNGPVGPSELQAHIERLRAAGGPLATSSALRLEAHLARLEGRLDDAVRLNEEADAIDVELGRGVSLVIMRQWNAEVFILQGRLDETISIFRESVGELEAMGETSFLSTSLIRLAHVLYLRGEPEEAERLAIEGEAMGASEDVINFAWGRALRAMVLADRGEFEEAESLARQAESYAYKTDFSWAHAAAHETLAQVLASGGRADEARRERERVIEIYESYGNAFEADRARALLVEL